MGRFGACKPAFVFVCLKHTKCLLAPAVSYLPRLGPTQVGGLKTKSGTTKWKGGETKILL